MFSPLMKYPVSNPGNATGQTNCTGFEDTDYPCLDTSLPAVPDLPFLNSDIHHVPLPPELIEEFPFVYMLPGLNISGIECKVVDYISMLCPIWFCRSPQDCLDRALEQ